MTKSLGLAVIGTLLALLAVVLLMPTEVWGSPPGEQQAGWMEPAENLVAVELATLPEAAVHMPAATVEQMTQVHAPRTLDRYQRVAARCGEASIRGGGEKRWRAWCMTRRGRC